MSTFVALASHANTRGSAEIARGSATEVALAIQSFEGWIGTLINVVLLQEGEKALTVDQVVIETLTNRRTICGWECRLNIQEPASDEWGQAARDVCLFRRAPGKVHP